MSHYRTSSRAGPRVASDIPATIHQTPGEGTPLPVIIRELGSGGALCESQSAPPAVGATVTLNLQLPGRTGGDLPVAVPAVVMRIDGRNPVMIALSFARAPRLSLEPIKRFILRARLPPTP